MGHGGGLGKTRIQEIEADFHFTIKPNFNTMYTTKITLPIRYRDIDMNHHVNNAVYFTYMENARLEILRDELLKYHDQGMQFVVAEASCTYIRPIKLDDTLVCEMSFHPVRPTAFDIGYLFKNPDTGKVFAEGRTRMVLFNENSGRPIPIPDWFTEEYLS